MKKHNYPLVFYLLISLFLAHAAQVNAQVKIGDNPLQIHPYAILEIESSQQGVLIPRMTTKQRDAAFTNSIPNGLLIFNTDNNHIEIYLSSKNSWEGISNHDHSLRLEDDFLILNDEHSIDLGPWKNTTDAQQLSLEGTKLKLENGGEVDLQPLFPNLNQINLQLEGNELVSTTGIRVDLSPLIPNSSDNQKLSIDQSILTLERGGSVDLKPILPLYTPQKIDTFQLVSQTLEISLSEDNEAPKSVSLAALNTDAQQLSLSENTLSLTSGGEVNLFPFTLDQDEQTLHLSRVNSNTFKIEIEGGNSLFIENNGGIVLNQTDSATLQLSSLKSPFELFEGIISNRSQQWDEEDFVVGSPQLDNDETTTLDNKRMFFDKRKGAFRVGIAQSDQWDENNRGTYSVAMGRNTLASGYHATAFGMGTQSEAWYSTTLGQGTVASSRTETVIGSFNTLYTPLGGSRDWDPLDRLFVVGNGTGSSTASRTNALVMFKNGNTEVNGIWTGPGFTIRSDPNTKLKKSRIKKASNKVLQLTPYQFENKKTKKIQFGFLADQVAKIHPELVYENNTEKGTQSIDYIGMIPLLLEVVKAQQKQIEILQKKRR